MDTMDYPNEIHLVLKDLIDQKSKRDRTHFTLSQLAKAINMPHSILSKLTHEDPNRRVNNPRLDTLCKIVNFFKQDGFDLTIDDLLSGKKAESYTVPLYFLDADLNNKIGSVDVELRHASSQMLAFVTDEYIEPMFKKGSIFVVDRMLEPQNNHLVAVQIPGHDNILIRKFSQIGGITELKKYDEDPNPMILYPTMKYRILGVVIQVNAKT